MEIRNHDHGFVRIHLVAVRGDHHHLPFLPRCEFFCTDRGGVGEAGVSESVLVPNRGQRGFIPVNIRYAEEGHQVDESGGFRWPRDVHLGCSVHDENGVGGDDGLVGSIANRDDSVPGIASLEYPCLENEAACPVALFNIVQVPSHVDNFNRITVGVLCREVHRQGVKTAVGG